VKISSQVSLATSETFETFKKKKVFKKHQKTHHFWGRFENTLNHFGKKKKTSSTVGGAYYSKKELSLLSKKIENLI
jgi:hypothetical protein